MKKLVVAALIWVALCGWGAVQLHDYVLEQMLIEQAKVFVAEAEQKSGRIFTEEERELLFQEIHADLVEGAQR